MFSYPDPQDPSVVEYRIDLEVDPDTIAIDILLHNEIPGIVPVTKRQVDGLIRLRYEASGAIPGSIFLQNQVSDSDIVAYLRSITEGLLNAQRFMLDENSYVLDPNSVFFYPDEKIAKLIYVPVKGQPVQSASRFLSSLVQHFQIAPRSLGTVRLQILDYLRQDGQLDLRGLLKYLLNLEVSLRIPTPPVPPARVQTSAPQPNAPQQSGGQHYSGSPAVQAPYIAQKSTQEEERQMSPPQELLDPLGRSGISSPGAVGPAVEPPQPHYQGVAYQLQQPPVASGRPHADAAEPKPKRKAKSKNKVARDAAEHASDVSSDEKPMTLFYLMAHYSSENKKKYDQQRAATKASKPDTVSDSQQPGPVPYASHGSSGVSMPSGSGYPRDSRQGPGNVAHQTLRQETPHSDAHHLSARPLDGASANTPSTNAELSHYYPSGEQISEEDFGHTVLFGQQGEQGEQITSHSGAPTALGDPSPQYLVPPQSQSEDMAAQGAVPEVVPQHSAQGSSFVLPVVSPPDLDPTALSDTSPGQQLPIRRVLVRVLTGESFPVDRDEFVIGRTADDAHLILADRTVSKRHVTIFRESAGWSIQDRGATNGVLLNGAQIPVGERVPLVEGSTILLGDEQLRFEVD